jgi:hypothetical protein
MHSLAKAHLHLLIDHESVQRKVPISNIKEHSSRSIALSGGITNRTQSLGNHKLSGAPGELISLGGECSARNVRRVVGW